MKSLKPGQPILTVTHLKRKFGDRVILKDVTFSLQPASSRCATSCAPTSATSRSC